MSTEAMDANDGPSAVWTGRLGKVLVVSAVWTGGIGIGFASPVAADVPTEAEVSASQDKEEAGGYDPNPGNFGTDTHDDNDPGNFGTDTHDDTDAMDDQPPLDLEDIVIDIGHLDDVIPMTTTLPGWFDIPHADNDEKKGAACVDSDGDGWGWNGSASCKMTAYDCVDSDGDGWGWIEATRQSCKVR